MTPTAFADRCRAWAAARPLAAAELLAALAATAALAMLDESPFFVVHALALAALRGLGASMLLLFVDPVGALTTLGRTATVLVLVFGPGLAWVRTWPRHRLAWLPIAAIPLLIVLGSSFAAITRPVMWALLVATSAVGWVAARRRWVGALALAPMVVCAEPTLAHGPFSHDVWTPARLAPRCEANDGRRPRGMTPDMAAPRYYAVTQLDAQLLLVTGDRRSYWLRRGVDGTFAIDAPSRAHGNLWQGCVAGRTLWFTKNHHLFGVERLADELWEHELVTDVPSPDPPGVVEHDLAEPACDPSRGRVFATELVSGAVREITPGTGAQRRIELGGFNLQYMRRADGRLVGIDTARLVVVDPDEGRVVEWHAAGIAAMGIDLCAADGAVAVADMAGRVRLFERAPSGEYRFRRGTTLTAPRRIAFSPDCRRIAVTSADDRTLRSLRRSDLAVEATYHVGPGLRDVTFVDDRTIAVADACMATFLDAPP